MTISDQPKPATQTLPYLSSGRAQAKKLLICAMIGGSLLGLAGLFFTGTIIAVLVAAPILVFFSPVLISAAAALAMITTGVLFSGGLFAAAMVAMAEIYNYMAGKHPLMAEQINCLKMKINSMAGDVEEGERKTGDVE